MHTDDTRLVSPQHLARTQRRRSVARGSEARQQQPATYELGDAAESDDEPGRVGTQPEWYAVQQWDDERRDRYYEGEDALTG